MAKNCSKKKNFSRNYVEFFEIFDAIHNIAC